MRLAANDGAGTLDKAAATFTGQRAMKIVHVIPALTKGGAERVAIDLANWQAEAGHTVAMVLGLGIDADKQRALLNPRIEVRSLVGAGAGSLKQTYLRMPGWLHRNRAWLGQFDVMHCHLTFASICGTLAKFMFSGSRRKPAIVETNHAVGMAISALRRGFLAAKLGQRDGVVMMALDPYWEQFAPQHPEVIVCLIPNGVAAPSGRWGTDQQRAELRATYGIPASATQIVGTVGQLRDDRVPWRWVPIFAEIAAKLGPRVHFLIAGEGAARARVEAEIAKYGLTERVHLCGTVESSAEPIALMDLYVTLAVGEIVGLAGLEAAFAGVPLVAIQLRDGFVGSPDHWFWSSNADHEVAMGAVQLLSSQEVRADLAHRQQQHVVANFGVAAMAKSYEDFYRTVLSRTLQAN